MRISRTRIMALTAMLGLLFGLALTTACSQSAPASGNAAAAASRLSVIVRPAATVLSLGGEIEIRVTIANGGEQEVVWGKGSSHCRLSLLVVVAGEALQAGPLRMCTMDMVPYRLQPGEVYTEALSWDGTVLLGGQLQELAPDEYQVYGLGGATRSDAVVIALQ